MMIIRKMNKQLLLTILSILLSSSSLFMMIIAVDCILSSTEFNRFYGDQNIESYLTNMCRNFETKKLYIVLVDNHNHSIDIDNNNSEFLNLRNFFINKNCPYDYFDSLELAQSIIISEPKYRYRNVLILINSFQLSPTQIHLNIRELFELSQNLYLNCANCVPIIFLFHYDIHSLYNWLSEAILWLNQRFSCTIVSRFADSEKVLHLRPVIKGCLELNEIYWPKSQQDFDQLRISPLQCDLNQTIINIVINDVSNDCMILIFIHHPIN